MVSNTKMLLNECDYSASSLVEIRFAGYNPAHPASSFSTGAQDSHLQRVTIPEAAYIQLRRKPPEDEQDNFRNM
jgi:hypothetical protein